jgi:hypothetical protein
MATIPEKKKEKKVLRKRRGPLPALSENDTPRPIRILAIQCRYAAEVTDYEGGEN